MKQIKRDAAIINYQQTGNGDITLLFVHGSYLDQTSWKSQVDYFSPDYRVVTLDLPGQGKSGKERPHWSVQGFAEDVEAVIRELALKNVILIGHSLGAAVGLRVAIADPEPLLGFIAIDYFKNAGTPLPPEFQQQVKAIEQGLKTDFANTNEQYARTGLLTKETPAAITNEVVKVYRNAYQPMGAEVTPELFTIYKKERELLPQLPFKLRLINVDYMPVNEEALKQHTGSNGYEVLHMKGTCHFPMFENPEELNKLLKQHINKIVKNQLQHH